MDKTRPSKISVIVTTYNWTHALRAVLIALLAQKTSIPFEIIVADDGSKAETAEVVRHARSTSTIPIQHVWQPDEGFRVAAIRNKAILQATGDYIVFLDGDCIPRENFIERHSILAQPHTFISGNRVLLNRQFTLTVLSEMLPLHHWPLYKWLVPRLLGYCNRLLPFFSIPLGILRFLGASRWKGAKGCNISVWKTDLLKINGWEEKFFGWGYEDSDLVIRLLKLGVKRKTGRYYLPVIHLWHPEYDRSQERQNWKLLKTRQKSTQICAEKGLNQYQPSSLEEPSLQECEYSET